MSLKLTKLIDIFVTSFNDKNITRKVKNKSMLAMKF